MSAVDVRISRASKPQDYDACIQLQRELWGFTGGDALVGLPLLAIGNRYGSSVLTAKDPNGQIVGFSLAVLCQEARRAPFWWSYVTAVLPNRQGKAIGFQLKVAQRKDALDHGIKEIWWAVDAFQLKTAHFGFRKLGCITKQLEENLYGIRDDSLREGLNFDCLLAEWHLESSRVVDRVKGNPGQILSNSDSLQRIVKAVGNRPEALNLALDESFLLMEIPRHFDTIIETDRQLAVEWQKTVRAACRHYLGRGYAITDFLLAERPHALALYVFEKIER